MKKVYPVIFTQTESIILVEVPDMEILTEGTDMADAIEMARDAIGLKGITMQDDGEELPEPTKATGINPNKGTFAEDGDSILSLVDIDFTIYRRKLDNKTVRRNVTLPNWMNQEAERLGLNVSGVLQEALAERMER